MARKTKSRFFSVMVVGDNPQELLAQYDTNKQVEPYIKYKYLDAKKIQNKTISLLSAILQEPKKIGFNEFQLEFLRERLNAIKALSPFEYYMLVTEGLYYDEDGNAVSNENPQGKWSTCALGSHFSLPLILKDGSESYQAQSQDVDWDAMTTDSAPYVATWEMVMEGRSPQTIEEEKIYNTMKDAKTYLSKFKSKEDYVRYSTAFWYYAVVTKDGWVDMSTEPNEAKWVNEFVERFGKSIPNGETVSIFECSINDDKNVSDSL